jgi:uncharacterized protein (DUF1499 family)
MKYVWFFTLVIVCVSAGLFFAGRFGLLKGQDPDDLGVQNGKLKPPSLRPNSVSSQAELYPDHPRVRYARIPAIQFSGSADAAMGHIATILQGMERTVIVKQESDYIYAQCTTSLMQFTDDIEFWLDRNAGVIHTRSASRIGFSDRGVNRARIESIRAQLEAISRQ